MHESLFSLDFFLIQRTLGGCAMGLSQRILRMA